MRIVRYRVRKESGHYLIVDTHSKIAIATHTDPTDAHQAAGTLNYQDRLDRALKIRKHQLHVQESNRTRTPLMGYDEAALPQSKTRLF